MNGFLIAALQMALCLAPMAMGIFITMKVFNIPDITTDGSYTLGAAVTALLISNGYPIWMVWPISMCCGAVAGMLTGVIHTKLKVDALLSGILVMTSLYSINLTIMGRSNIPLIDVSTLFNTLSLFHNEMYDTLLLSLVVVLIFLTIIIYLLKTDFGISMRASGNNPLMSKALGVNNDRIKIIGLAMSNALTAMSGFLVAQYQGFADVNMGIGIVITGLGAVLIADAFKIWFGIKKISTQMVWVILGCLLFELILAFTLSIGVHPNLLKMCTAIFVLLIVALPKITESLSQKTKS
jgi:putative ABC transport system permease protein